MIHRMVSSHAMNETCKRTKPATTANSKNIEQPWSKKTWAANQGILHWSQRRIHVKNLQETISFGCHQLIDHAVKVPAARERTWTMRAGKTEYNRQEA